VDYALIILVIVLIGVFTLVYVTISKDEKDRAKVRASIKPGKYVSYRDARNILTTDYSYVTVLEVKDGWVKYVYTLNPSKDARPYSMMLNIFIDHYIPYPFEK
jgi:hypothetical protein